MRTVSRSLCSLVSLILTTHQLSAVFLMTPFEGSHLKEFPTKSMPQDSSALVVSRLDSWHSCCIDWTGFVQIKASLWLNVRPPITFRVLLPVWSFGAQNSDVSLTKEHTTLAFCKKYKTCPMAFPVRQVFFCGQVAFMPLINYSSHGLTI